MRILVTGGAGFIGSALVRYLINNTEFSIINVDKLSYAGNLDSLESVKNSQRYFFKNIDICNRDELSKIFYEYKPDSVMHLAAESHVDRSINNPEVFIQTNIMGTFYLLEESRKYFHNENKHNFRFHHISTDEVYGDLTNSNDLFTEKSPYMPSSPYSASKAGSDHLVRAWGRTFDLPVIITNCSNNYGPYHFPEKLIPHMILSAIKGMNLPIYGDGSQIRDWLYVDDHVKALAMVVEKGKIGQTYNIGGHNQKTNLEVVQTICDILEELAPNKPKDITNYKDLIKFVKDRPGHDMRYAIDASKIENELGWMPIETFETGLKKTIKWYLENEEWWQRVFSGKYRLGRLDE